MNKDWLNIPIWKFAPKAVQKYSTHLEYLLSQTKKNKQGCWIWQGKTDKDGYPRVSINKIKCRLVRGIYAHYKGTIPDNLVVRHVVCRNPKCINPDHLELGSIADNNYDRVIDGTIPRGENHFSSKQIKVTFGNGAVKLFESKTEFTQYLGYAGSGSLKLDKNLKQKMNKQDIYGLEINGRKLL